MEKKTLLLAMAIMLLSSIIFNGCIDDNTKTVNTTPNEKVNITEQDTFKFTIDEIKKKYTEDKIQNIIQFKDGYVLVESIIETVGNRFELYNLKTGEINTLPKSQFGYASLEKVINENYFILLSDGKDEDGPFGKFPYLIHCIRIKNDSNKDDNFIALYEDKYFNLDETVQSGSKEWDVMSDVIVTLDGLQVLFSPINGNEAGFYTDATDIPHTKTSYDKDKSQITFEIGTNQLGEKLKGMNKVILDDNQFISSYEIKQKDNKVYLVVEVKDLTKEYMVKIMRLPEGELPYFSVIFRGKQ